MLTLTPTVTLALTLTLTLTLTLPLTVTLTLPLPLPLTLTLTRKRGSIKAAKARQARVADALMMKGGAQIASPKLGALYIDIYGFPNAKVPKPLPQH